MREIATSCAGLAVLLGAQLASAQSSSPQPDSVTPPAVAANASAPAETSRSKADAHAAELVKVLDPAQYGPAFFTGAQAELVVPSVGASAVVLGYDAVWTQVELSLGVGVGGDPVKDVDVDDIYTLGLRLAVPIHRGIHADYALFAGGGAVLIDPAMGTTYALPNVGGGARFRMFMSPNVAVGATLGVTAFIRAENSSVQIGARPLGAASVVYFFR